MLLPRFPGLAILTLILSPGLEAAEFNGTFSATSNYYWRGYSKSDNHVSGQVNLDVSDISDGSGYYLGAWLASTDFGNNLSGSSDDVELVLYGGWSQQLTDDFYLDLQLSHYVFSEKLFGDDADYTEIYVLLHYRDLLTAEVSYAPDAYSIGPSTLNGQLTFRYPVQTFIDFSAGTGYFAARDVFFYDYAYWNAGITLKNERFSFDIRYFDSRKTNKKVRYPFYYYYYKSRALPFRSASTVVTLSVGF